MKNHWIAAAHVAEQLQNAGDPEAEATWQRAIDGIIAELPAGSGSVALRLSRFAYSLHDAGLDAEAYPLASRAASMAETDGDRFAIAVTQSRVGAILAGKREYARAEPLLRRSLAILEKVKGPDALDTAVAENNLAALYSDTGRPAEAEIQQRLALPIYKKYAGPKSQNYVAALANLYVILASEKRHEEGAPYLAEAMSIAEKNFPNTAVMARVESCEASLEFNRGHLKEAASTLAKAIDLQERTLGPNHPELATSLVCYARVLRALHNTAESKRAEARAQTILANARTFR